MRRWEKGKAKVGCLGWTQGQRLGHCDHGNDDQQPGEELRVCHCAQSPRAMLPGLAPQAWRDQRWRRMRGQEGPQSQGGAPGLHPELVS